MYWIDLSLKTFGKYEINLIVLVPTLKNLLSGSVESCFGLINCHVEACVC